MAPNERAFAGWRRLRGDASRVDSNPKGILGLVVPITDRDVHFISASDEFTDVNVANPTHPTLYIHSETTPATDYGTFAHDATDFVITAVGGGIRLVPVGDVQIDDGFGLIIGSATQVTISDGDGATNLIPELQVLGLGAADGSLVVASFNTTNTRAVSPHIALVKGAAATQVATTAVADNEVVGSIIAYGSDSADFESPVAAIEFVVDDASGPTTGEMGGSLEFYTTADAGETLTLSFTINNDQNIYVANANGVVVGHTAQVAVLAATPELQVLGTAAADSGLALLRSSADTAGPVLYLAKARDAIGTFTTAITTGDVLGSIQAIGADTADLNANGNAAAAIFFLSTGTIAADRIPGSISLRVATDAAPSVLTERVLITGGGQINVTPVTDVTFANNTGVVIGHTAQMTVGSVAEFQVLGTALADASMIVGIASADAVGPEIQFSKSRNAAINTVATSIVNDNDVVGRIVWLPADSVDFATEAAVFFAEVDDASPAAGDIGMAFVWSSMAGGAAALAEKMRLTASGQLVVSTSVRSHANMTGAGLIIDQATIDTLAVALKSSTDVAHGLTTGTLTLDAATDDYLTLSKLTAAEGGALIQVIAEDGGSAAIVLRIEAYGATADTTDTTTSTGLVTITAAEHDGSNATIATPTNQNIFVVQGHSAANTPVSRLLLKGDDGELHLGNTTVASLADDQDDVMLSRSMQILSLKESGQGYRESPYDKNPFNDYDKLHALGVYGPKDERGEFLFALQPRLALHEGAIFQLFTDLMDVVRALPNEIQAKLTGRLQDRLVLLGGV